jgi:hypothetical protein
MFLAANANVFGLWTLDFELWALDLELGTWNFELMLAFPTTTPYPP